MSYPMPPYPRPAGSRPIPAGSRPIPRPGTPIRQAIHFFTVAEVAVDLRVSKMTIYRLYHEGLLKGAVRVGRSIRVPEEAVKSLLRAGDDVAGAIEALRATPVND